MDVVLDQDGSCRICAGVWLDEQHVREQAQGELEYTGGTYSERQCPVCDEKMDEPLVFDVPIDRCALHGMWFDKTELAEVLHRSRSDEWRLYGGTSGTPAVRMDPISGLIAAVRLWRKGRNR